MWRTKRRLPSVTVNRRKNVVGLFSLRLFSSCSLRTKSSLTPENRGDWRSVTPRFHGTKISKRTKRKINQRRCTGYLSAIMHTKDKHVNFLVFSAIFAGTRFIKIQKFCCHGNMKKRLLVSVSHCSTPVPSFLLVTRPWIVRYKLTEWLWGREWPQSANEPPFAHG